MDADDDYGEGISKGDRFGRLVVEGRLDWTRRDKRLILRCACGECEVALPGDLVAGRHCQCRSCNAYDKMPPLARTVGSDIYRSLKARYRSTERRCSDPRHSSYPDYGGRGIELRLSEDEYVGLLVYGLGYTADRGLTVDRIDNDGHYERGNLRLADAGEQARNRRSTRCIQHDGLRLTLDEFWREYISSTSRTVTYQRHADGWSAEELIEGKRAGAGV